MAWCSMGNKIISYTYDYIVLQHMYAALNRDMSKEIWDIWY